MTSQIAKRYACDRCRAQKLRCIRTTHNAEKVCDRCIRAGLECITGSGRRLGRPSPYVTDPSRSTIFSEEQRLAGQQTRPRGSESTFANTAQAWEEHNSLDDDFSTFHGFPLEGLLMPEGIQQSVFDMQSPFDFGDLYVSSPGDTATDTTPDTNDHERSAQVTKTLATNNEAVLMISNLTSHISHQAAALASQSVHPYPGTSLRQPSFNAQHYDSTREDMSEHLICENTLQLLMRFAFILQTLVPAQCGNTPSDRPLQDTPLAFMLLSTYIQLLRLLNDVFNRVHHSVRSGAWMSGLSPAGNTPITHSSEHVHALPRTTKYPLIMVRVCQHQLQIVEQLLGLPQACCHWKPQIPGVDIVEREDSAVMGGELVARERKTSDDLKASMEK